MINLNISPEGEITISQETPGERRVMSEHYADQEAASTETERDEERQAFFKQGWDSAVRECMLNFVAGRLPEFFNEIGVVTEDYSMTDVSRSDLATATGLPREVIDQIAEIFQSGVPTPTISDDPHHNEPQGVGDEREFADDLPADAWAINPNAVFDMPEPVVRKVADSGEPELEKIDTEFNEGIWTISDEELQALKDAEFERGQNYVSPTVPPRYTDEQIREITEQNRKLKFSAIRGAFDRAVAAASEGTPANSDRTPTILNMLFTDLGFEVTA